MTEPTLHPNLARIAAAYDHILEQLGNHAINEVTARERIAQLEARDDDGVRWAIDPDTGAWTRKTAFGDMDFDGAPPTYGYLSADAYDLSQRGDGGVYNPGSRVALARVDESVLHAGSLLGATRRLPEPAPKPSLLSTVAASPVARFALVAAVVLAGVLTFTHANTHQGPTSEPQHTSAPR